MPEEKMQNPYEKDGIVDSEIKIGRGAACALIAVFALILLLPPLYRNVYQLALSGEDASEPTLGGDGAWVPAVELFKKLPDETITQHLKSFESDLEDKAAFTEPPRQFVQGVLSSTLREGNRKTYIGRDGWLYLKPAIESLTGYGPLAPEPDSVAKDPNRKPWNSPLGAIETFAAQLEELGVELILVPIPVKPMIYPEHITGKESKTPLQHRDSEDFYKKVEALPNASVINPTAFLWNVKSGQEVFLKQDTHWTPEGMRMVAKMVATEILKQDKIRDLAKSDRNIVKGEKMEVSNLGDLVDQLNLPDGGAGRFDEETVTIQPIEDADADPASEITLLGDSFTNIYSTASLEWGEDAGFAQHLALNLGRPIDVIAINGQASTGVREEFARRGKEHIRKKKVVIWAIAARDLFLSETAARENSVEWESVVFPDVPDKFKSPNKDKIESLEITATLVKKSAIADPSKVNYRNAYFVSDYRVDEIHAGTYEGESILVAEWAFQEKKLSAASSRQSGTQVRLKLVPISERPKIEGIQPFDDFNDDIEKMVLTRYWSDPLEQESSGGVDTRLADPARASLFATIACLVVTLVAAGVALGSSRQRNPDS